MAGLQDDLSALVKQYSLTWITLRPCELATLAEQLFRTLAQKSEQKTTRAMGSQIQMAQFTNLQMKQLCSPLHQ